MPLARTCFARPASPAGATVTKPQLTSLIDVLTILLVFLLKSFSMEGDLVAVSDDLVLPESISREKPVPTVNVEITQSGIHVDGTEVLPLNAVGQGDSLMIEPLYRRLEAISIHTGTEGQDHEVTIHCDKRMDFQVVKRVMYTCARAEYADFSLLVLQED